MRGRLGLYPLIALSVWALAACNDSGGSATGSQEASGASQKGPFRAGGEASAVLLAADGTADGQPVTGSIDEQGQYRIAGIDWSGPTRLRMSGTFFDEVAGNFSSDSRVLTAVAAVEEGAPPETNVNLFTHFEAERTTTLMAGGGAFDDALARARSDLQTALDISSDPGDLNLLQAIDGLSEDSANLLLFSAAVQEGGIGQSGLDELAADFADDGQFNGQGADELSTILEKATDALLTDARTKLKNQYSTEPPDSTGGGFGWKLSACAAARLTEPRVFCDDETYEGTKFNDDGEEILYFPDTTGFYAFSLGGDVSSFANWTLHSDSVSGSEVGDASERDGDTTTDALDADDRYAFDLYLAGLADANDEFTLSGGPVSQGDAFDPVSLTVGEVHGGRVGYVFVNASQGNGPATSWYRFDSQGGDYRVRTSGYTADASGGLKIEIYEGDAGQDTINDLNSLDQVDFVNGSGTSSNELTATLEAGKPHFVLITNLFTDYRRVNSPAESTGSVEFDLEVTRE